MTQQRRDEVAESRQQLLKYLMGNLRHVTDYCDGKTLSIIPTTKLREMTAIVKQQLDDSIKYQFQLEQKQLRSLIDVLNKFSGEQMIHIFVENDIVQLCVQHASCDTSQAQTILTIALQQILCRLCDDFLFSTKRDKLLQVLKPVSKSLRQSTFTFVSGDNAHKAQFLQISTPTQTFEHIPNMSTPQDLNIRQKYKQFTQQINNQNASIEIVQLADEDVQALFDWPKNNSQTFEYNRSELVAELSTPMQKINQIQRVIKQALSYEFQFRFVVRPSFQRHTQMTNVQIAMWCQDIGTATTLVEFQLCEQFVLTQLFTNTI